MAMKKKDLEIIYNLQWKNKSANGGDRANIIGMYDIPATTLNWEIFKSYLLKNSGTVGDDVKVSYITDSNREFPIESQTDFQIALYAFRRKARMGDIVNLRLDRISDQSSGKNNRHSNDVETQIDSEAASLSSACCASDAPPEWFITYMSQFKKNFTDELATTVSNIVSNIKTPASNPSCHHVRKSKADNWKRIRRVPPFIIESIQEDKDFIKSIKLEGKLERKLEKLELKTKKIRDKKIGLIIKSSDSDAGPSSSSRSRSAHASKGEDDLLEMDAVPVNTQTSIPHMLGGEVYMHQWQVMNIGKLPWTSKTSLMFTWGSKALRPLETIVSVPYLKPGEKGTLAVRLQIPNQPGEYECYWHFYHKNRRFGHWLGCQVIVDPFDLKGNKSVLETTAASPYEVAEKELGHLTDEASYNIDDHPVTQYTNMPPAKLTVTGETSRGPFCSTSTIMPCRVVKEDMTSYFANVQKPRSMSEDLSSRANDIKLQDPTDSNCSSDSDNHSVISLSESNCSKGMPDEFVVVPIPDCFKVDNTPGSTGGNNQQDNVTKDAPEQLTTATSQVPEENKGPSEKLPENYDDNNNSPMGAEAKVNDVKLDDASSNSGSHKSDIVVVSLPDDKKPGDFEYAYVLVDGQKIHIPKEMIKSEYLQAATGTSNNITTRTDISSDGHVNQPVSASSETLTDSKQTVFFQTHHMEPSYNDLSSHCSAAGSCFSDVNSTAEKNARLFIFPQDCPGYEVVQSEDAETADQDVYHWAESGTHYAYSASAVPLYRDILQPSPAAANTPPLNLSKHDRNPFADVAHTPNYQQTSPEMRASAAFFDACSEGAATVVENAATNQAPGIQTADDGSEQNTRTGNASTPNTPPLQRAEQNATPVTVHILPETLVTGAASVASSAMNTARSVINMIVPNGQPGKWVNGHWVSTNPATPREANLQALAEMGFWNRDLNATLLARYNDDLSRVVGELVQ